MLRGPVQASFPSLEHFPREAGASGHVYPFPARSASPVIPQADLRLPSNIASATFWRSPYSEALRQSRSSLPKKLEGYLSSRESHSLVQEDKEKNVREEKGSEQAKSILKNGSEGRDSGSDTSSENVRQIRGILCKSSVSSSSRQSGGKVQKRVKFDESVDRGQRGQCLRRHASSASSSGAAARYDHRQHQHRVMSASALTGKAQMRMPTLRHDGDRLQSIDKSCLHHNHPLSHSQAHLHHHNPHQHPHIPRPNTGPLIRSSSVPDLTLPRATPRGVNLQPPYHLVHSPHNATSAAAASTSSRLSPTALEFKIYRQAPSVAGSPSPRVSETGLSQPPPHGRTRFFATRGHSTGSRSLVRLSRSLTSPAITVQRPPKRSTPSSPSHDDLPLVVTPSRVDVHPEASQKHVTARDVLQVRHDEDEKDEERRETFLDDDKTVQILHWLKEVDHKQAREGRCPVFVHGIYREG